MSATGDGESRPGREVAHRLFAAEYDDASLSYAESDEERAPNYVVTPTGARVNRTFVVGALTEVTSVNEEMVRARVVDPTGAFVVYAGQYQPDQLAFLERAEPPQFVAVTGKARTFEPDDGDQVYTSIRPESIATVDAETRDRWVVATAEHTIERIGTYAAAAELDARGETLTAVLRENGVPERLATGIPLAKDHYGSTPDYLDELRTRVVEAVETVAGERDQVEQLSTAPGDATGGDANFAGLAARAGASLSEADVPTPEPAGDSSSDRESAASAAEEPGASGAAVGTASQSSGPDAGTDAADPADSIDATADDAGSAAAASTDEPGEFESSGSTVGSEDAEPAAADGEDGPSAVDADADGSDDDEADRGDEADVDDDSVESDVEPGSDDAERASDADGARNAGDADGADETAADAGPTDDELGDFDGGDLDGEMYELDEEERREVEEEFGTEFTTGADVDAPGETDVDVPDPADGGDEDPADGGDESGADPDDETGSDADEEQGDEPDEQQDVATDDGPADERSGSDDADDVSEADDTDDESEVDDGSDVEDADDDSEADDAADIDLQSYVVETMGELDDGDGADRAALVDRVTDETGASVDEVESAIQDALMGGQCYEPDDETLKAI